MADTFKTTKQLKLVAGFSDGDERTLSIDNPAATVSAAAISALDSLAAGVIIGDKYGAAFTKFKDAGIYETTTVYLDIQPQE